QLAAVGGDRGSRSAPVDDDGRVGAIAVVGAGERAVPGDLLLDDAFDDEVSGEPDTRVAQRLREPDERRNAGLVVPAAASIETVAVDLGRPRVTLPQLRRAGRDRVDMRVEDERAPATRPAQHADDVRASRVVAARRSPAGK